MLNSLVAWNNINTQPDAANFILLLGDLRDRLPDSMFMLTASLHYNIHIDLEAAARFLDLVNVKVTYNIPRRKYPF